MQLWKTNNLCSVQRSDPRDRVANVSWSRTRSGQSETWTSVTPSLILCCPHSSSGLLQPTGSNITVSQPSCSLGFFLEVGYF